MTAGEELTRALLTLAEAGRVTPCQGRQRDRWTSDDHDERAWAAGVCRGLNCAVFEECGAAADEANEKWGVWAGVDRGPKTGPKPHGAPNVTLPQREACRVCRLPVTP